MRCPICNGDSTSTNFKHLNIKDADIFKCDNCDYHFVDCSNYTKSDIFNHQNSNVAKFGHNLNRNTDYLNYLIILKESIQIKKLLEIGTPRNYDFLSKVYSKFSDSIELHSYDVIENNLPKYIKFHSNKEELINSCIDIIFCIHTLEHIPTNELVEFVNFCKYSAKYLVFEVPYCKTSQRIKQSITAPHYSFFTEKSIKKLFGNVNIKIIGNVLKFNNI